MIPKINERVIYTRQGGREGWVGTVSYVRVIKDSEGRPLSGSRMGVKWDELGETVDYSISAYIPWAREMNYTTGYIREIVDLNPVFPWYIVGASGAPVRAFYGSEEEAVRAISEAVENSKSSQDYVLYAPVKRFRKVTVVKASEVDL
jgi:hypothetical protein